MDKLLGAYVWLSHRVQEPSTHAALNQKTDGALAGGFKSIGSYTFAANGTDYVEISNVNYLGVYTAGGGNQLSPMQYVSLLDLIICNNINKRTVTLTGSN